MATGEIEIARESPESDLASVLLGRYYAELGSRFPGGFDPDRTAAAPVVEPTSAKPDQRALVLPIQAELRRIGCYAGGDSDWGSVPMQLSVVKYALYAKLAATPAGPDEALLESLKGQRGRICPLECPANETAVDGRCVAKSCAPGEVMGRDGACQKRPIATRVVAPRKAAPAAAPAPAKGHCFNFNGSQYCE